VKHEKVLQHVLVEFRKDILVRNHGLVIGNEQSESLIFHIGVQMLLEIGGTVDQIDERTEFGFRL